MTRVIVVGGGWVGAPIAALMARAGARVVVVERNEQRRLDIGTGFAFDDGGAKVAWHLAKQESRVSTAPSLIEAGPADVVICCVGTPTSPSGAFDLSHIETVADEFADWWGLQGEGSPVFVMKSTVPPGTGESLIARINAALLDGRTLWDYASMPEFLAEGTEWRDLTQSQRPLVIGTRSHSVAKKLWNLFDEGRDNSVSHVLPQYTTVVEAELIKLASNAALATRVAFANEIASIAKGAGSDASVVLAGVRADPRIGDKYMHEGPGFAGPCLPKDLAALLDFGVAPRAIGCFVLRGVTDANYLAVRQPADAVWRFFNGNMEGVKIAVWGLSFKPGCDDIRGSASEAFIHDMLDRGAVLRLFDENRNLWGESEVGHVLGDRWKAAEGCQAIVCFDGFDPAWSQGSWKKMKALRPSALFFDARDSVRNHAQLVDAGFCYEGIGRPLRRPQGEE